MDGNCLKCQGQRSPLLKAEQDTVVPRFTKMFPAGASSSKNNIPDFVTLLL